MSSTKSFNGIPIHGADERHGLGHAGVQGLLRHRDDEGPAAQGRGRIFMGGQLARLRPAEKRAAYSGGAGRRG